MIAAPVLLAAGAPTALPSRLFNPMAVRLLILVGAVSALLGWSLYGSLWGHVPEVSFRLHRLFGDPEFSATAWFDPVLTLVLRAALFFAGTLVLFSLPARKLGLAFSIPFGVAVGLFVYRFLRSLRHFNNLRFLAASLTFHDPFRVLLYTMLAALLLWLAQWRVTSLEL